MEFSVVADGLVFPESPVWRGDRLWFTDAHAGSVHTLDRSSTVTTVANVPGRPTGLGFLADGTPLVLASTERCLYRVKTGRAVLHADLSALVDFPLSDLLVLSNDRAFVGNYGFDLEAGAEPATTTLVCVDTDGSAWVVALDLLFPNGMAVTPEGRLLVAESMGRRISSFGITAAGGLDDPQVWADVQPHIPVGICLDAEGAAWVTDPVEQQVVRIAPGRGVIDTITTGATGAYGCALGGPDGRTLYITTADSSDPAETTALRSGRLQVCDVDVGAPTR